MRDRPSAIPTSQPTLYPVNPQIFPRLRAKCTSTKSSSEPCSSSRTWASPSQQSLKMCTTRKTNRSLLNKIKPNQLSRNSRCSSSSSGRESVGCHNRINSRKLMKLTRKDRSKNDYLRCIHNSHALINS